MQQSASCAPLVQTFWPFTTKWSSNTSARVDSPARSLPAPGSLIPRHAVRSPFNTGSAHRSRCSGVPWSTTEGAKIVAPWRFHERTMPRRASSSKYTIVCTGVALRPPSSGGQPGTSQPASNWARCHRRAQSGRCALDRGRSVMSAAVGALASSHASSSARNRSVSSS